MVKSANVNVLESGGSHPLGEKTNKIYVDRFDLAMGGNWSIPREPFNK